MSCIEKYRKTRGKQISVVFIYVYVTLSLVFFVEAPAANHAALRRDLRFLLHHQSPRGAHTSTTTAHEDAGSARMELAIVDTPALSRTKTTFSISE